MVGPVADVGVALLIPHRISEDDTQAADHEALQMINFWLGNNGTFLAIQEGWEVNRQRFSAWSLYLLLVLQHTI